MIKTDLPSLMILQPISCFHELATDLSHFLKKSSQFLLKLTQNINTIQCLKYCEEGKEMFQFSVHCAEFGTPI